MQIKTLLLILLLLSLSSCFGSTRQHNNTNNYYSPSNNSKNHTSTNNSHYKIGTPYTISGKKYYPLQTSDGYDATGVASWYGPNFHGGKTANGERFDMNAMTAAHLTLPLPTLARVTNLENGRSVIVRINDRGPFARDRILDLSRAAAEKLAVIAKGTAKIRIQALEATAQPFQAERRQQSANNINHANKNIYNSNANTQQVASLSTNKIMTMNNLMYVQLGAFGLYSTAKKLKSQLLIYYPNVTIHPLFSGNNTLYRVRIGPIHEEQRLQSTLSSLQQQGYADARPVTE
ncbi:MAG: septal ring lytic transglycosylase RlpA family protein [Mariprofundales bacterium]